MRRALASKEPKSAIDLLSKTFSAIDRAVQKGVVKKNTAARYKSRVHKRIKALG
jgi:small subunit ribosomal protein S20